MVRAVAAAKADDCDKAFKLTHDGRARAHLKAAGPRGGTAVPPPDSPDSSWVAERPGNRQSAAAGGERRYGGHVVSGEVQTGTVAVSCGNFPEPARPYGRVEDGPPAAAPDLSRATSPA